MVKLENYSLEDSQLIQWALNESEKRRYSSDGEYHRVIFVPQKTLIIVGKKIGIAGPLKNDISLIDSTPIIQYPFGRRIFLLSPKTLVVTYCIIAHQIIPSTEVFVWTLRSIIKALARQGIEDIEIQGSSHLAADGKKLFFSSIYRRLRMLLFYGVLNVSEEPEFISRYLKSLIKEPDRLAEHTYPLFATSIAAIYPGFVTETFRSDLLRILDENWLMLIKS